MAEARYRYWTSYLVLFITLWFTLLVLAMKLWASWATRSLSLFADALHSVLDCFSSLLSVMAMASLHQMSGRQIRSHRSIETSAILLLVALLGFAGFSLLGVSIYQLPVVFYDPSLSSTEISLSLVLLLSIISAIHFCLILIERHKSIALENPVLRHNAHQMLRDVWLTVLLLPGLASVSQGYVWLDPLMAIALLLMVVPSFWCILKWQVPSLLYQMAIAPEVLTQIAFQVEGVAYCDRVRSQGVVGEQLFIQMRLRLHPEFMAVAHIIAERLQILLRERYGSVQAKIYIKQSSTSSRSWWNF